MGSTPQAMGEDRVERAGVSALPAVGGVMREVAVVPEVGVEVEEPP